MAGFLQRWLRRSQHGRSAHVLSVRRSRLHVEQLEDRLVLAGDTTGPLVAHLGIRSPVNSPPLLSAIIRDAQTGGSAIRAAEYFVDTVGVTGQGTPMHVADGVWNSPTEKVKAVLPAALFDALAEGTHTIFVHGKDSAGNWGDVASATFTKDTAAPFPPSAPVLVAASDSGFSTNDNITSLTRLTVTGTAIDAARVTIYDGTKVVGRGSTVGDAYTISLRTLNSGAHTLTARATDAAGNVSDLSDPLVVTIDNRAPKITNVVAPSDATYGVGEAMDFTVTFSESVIVSGAPLLPLVIGSTQVAAEYVSGSGSSSLLFRYVVPVGVNDSNGIVTRGNLTTHGGSIQDVAGNNTRRGFAAARLKNVLVDGTAAPAPAALAALAAGSSASFVGPDSLTQGTWQGTYGNDGYRIAGDIANYPSYAQVNFAGNLDYTWSSSTTATRALQRGSGTGRVAATWYSASSFTVDVNLTDGQSHRVSLYFLDWDGPRRAERVEVLDGDSGAVLDTQDVTGNFWAGRYLTWDLQGHVVFRITSLQSPNAVLSGLFFASPAATPPAASFLKTDVLTQGVWQGTYGGDGYQIAGDATSIPSYAEVSLMGKSDYSWSSSTTDTRALQRAGGAGMVAATWYSASSFTVDVNLTDGKSHLVSLYFLDWDGPRRSERVDILDPFTGSVLDSQTVSNFASGQYLVWNLQGHVQIRITSLQQPNAVLSGIFFGTPATTIDATATFGDTDTQTLGAWRKVYGYEGYSIAGDTSSYPSYVQVSMTGNRFYTWESSTNDPRALQRSSGNGSVAATWYSMNSFTMDVNITDGKTHRLSLYFVDYNGPWRSERVEVLDPATGDVLDSRTVSDFVTGKYLTWEVHGHVRFRFTTLAGNAVLSGVFFGPARPAATYLRADTLTQSQWQGTYGADGYQLVGDATNLSSYAQLSVQGAQTFNWAGSTTDPRGLERADGSGLFASTWYAANSFTIDVNLKDMKSHQVALYIVDWENFGRKERIDIVNADTGAVLDSQVVSDFATGRYLVWNLQGHVQIRLTNLAGPNAVVSGVFLGGDPRAQITFWEQWLSRYVDLGGAHLTQANAAQTVLAAVHRMFLQATTFADPDEGDVRANLVDIVRQNPTVAYWGLCNQAVDLARYVMQVFNVPTREIVQFHTVEAGDNHDTLEYYSVEFGKWVYADPLYGMTLLNKDGIPASVDDILGEIAQRGHDSATWTYQPVQVIDPQAPPADTRYGNFTLRDYSEVLFYFLNIVVQRRVEYAYSNGYLLGGNERLANWIVHDTTAFADTPLGPTIPAAQRATLLQDLLAHMTPENGYYSVSAYVLRNESVVTGEQALVFQPNNDLNYYPSYAEVAVQGSKGFVWASSTTDPRALQRADSGRIAATRYGETSFTVDVRFGDGQSHRVSLYFVDWNNTGRSQRIDVLDASSGQVLDSQTIANFSGGRYLTWNVKGQVRFVITNLQGSNAVLSGIFFDPVSTGTVPAIASGASFVATDDATKGSWKGTYGADGFGVFNDLLPSTYRDKYLQNLQTSPAVSSDQQALLTWIDRYVDRGATPLVQDEIARFLFTAQRHMFLQATTSLADVGGNLYDRVIADSSTTLWADSTAAADFLLRALHAFNVPATRVTLWQDATHSHDLVEYYSQYYGKFLLYDPFYGVTLTKPDGTPAGIDDIRQAVQSTGSFDHGQWAFSQIAYPYDPTPGAVAADSRYQANNGTDYGLVLASSLNLISVLAQPLFASSADQPEHLIVYDYTVLTGMSTADRDALLASLAQAESSRSGGAFDLAIESLLARGS